MQTLGLSSESKRSDGRLKGLLWPTVDNLWDVNYLGQQGMWICTILAVITLISTVLTANLVIIAIGILSALFYLMGGMGVREASWPAAALVFAVYVIGLLAQIPSPTPGGIIRILIAILLLSNIRAAFLASEWKPAEEGEDRPTRFNESFSDKFIDQMPQKLWPKLQIPFIVLAISMLLLTLLGIGFVFAQRFGMIPHK